MILQFSVIFCSAAEVFHARMHSSLTRGPLEFLDTYHKSNKGLFVDNDVAGAWPFAAVGGAAVA